MKKVRFSCPWNTGSESILKRILLQFLTSEDLFKNIEIVEDDSYDIAVCFNYINIPVFENKKYLILPQEPYWTGAHQQFLSSNITIFGFEKNKYYGGTCIETPMLAFYGGQWILDEIEIWCYKYLTNTEFIKTKNISCSITTLNGDRGENCIYPKRIKLLHSLLNEPYIDLYGCATLADKGKNVELSYKKIDFVSPYKFSLTVENTHSKNYLTEKFYDPILTDCIPIYYGVNNLKEIYPEDGYILIEDIEDIDSIKKLLIEINNNADDIYQQKIAGARKIKERFFKEYNMIKKIMEFCENN